MPGPTGCVFFSAKGNTPREPGQKHNTNTRNVPTPSLKEDRVSFWYVLLVSL